MQNRQKITFGEKVGYSLGDVAANLVFQMMMIYQLKFYTDVFGLSGAVAGGVLLVAPMASAFADPLVGLITDRTSTRWGKYRPWLLWTAVPFCTFYVLAFNNPGIEDKGLLAVLPDLLVREHPDAVLLMGGTNDIAYGGDLAGARANMGAKAHLIIARGGLPLIGIPPGLRRPIRREWAELMPERAAELLAEYQSWLRRFAAAFRLPVLDFDRAFTR